MKTTYQIIASGVGGQGLLSFAETLGNAATLASKNVTVTTFYGSESRGTFTKADLTISTNPIAFPDCEDPDIIICLHQVAYNQYKDSVGENVTLIYDSEAVQVSDSCKATQYGHPFTSIARGLGRAGSANLVAAGFLLKLFPVLDPQDLKKALAEKFGKAEKVIALNNQMVDAGLSLS